MRLWYDRRDSSGRNNCSLAISMEMHPITPKSVRAWNVIPLFLGCLNSNLDKQDDGSIIPGNGVFLEHILGGELSLSFWVPKGLHHARLCRLGSRPSRNEITVILVTSMVPTLIGRVFLRMERRLVLSNQFCFT
jgi:hypothetical protein